MRHPVPSHAQALDAAATIVARHIDAQDPDLAKLGDGIEEVVAFLARHGDREAGSWADVDSVDAYVTRADVVDALLVLDYLDDTLRTILRRWRLGVILAGYRSGLGPAALAGPLHQPHRQGVQRTVERLRAALDPQVGIADPAAARRIREAAQRAANDRREQAAAIVEFAQSLTAHSSLVPADLDAAVDVDDIAAAIPPAGTEPTALLVASLRLLADELTTRDDLDPTLRAVVDAGLRALPPRRRSAPPPQE